MATETYADVYAYGRALLDSGDLDPLYTMIGAAELPRSKLAEYLFAYLCFYDTGTASWIVDQPDYWGAMTAAADDATHPRGGDRRHFRGTNARKAVAAYAARGLSAEELLDALAGHFAETTLAELMTRVRTLPQFGPTIAFKAADVLERFGFARVRFGEPGEAEVMSETPKAGAADVAASEGYAGRDAATFAHFRLLDELGESPAPPWGERTLTVLETETVLCKWRHYLNGSYRVGKGKESQRKGLLPYRATCPTAERMYAAGVGAGLWT
jgi:hypothetical protein